MAKDNITNIPQIVETLSPDGNSFEVRVRMTTELAAKFPKKPWGTRIDEIGLAPKDASRFLDYTLVDVVPLRGETDLLWVFHKLPGPVYVESRWNEELEAQVVRQSNLTEPPLPPDLGLINTSFSKVTYGMSLKQVEEIPKDALDSKVTTFPTRVNLGNLPRELLSVEITWNENFSIGTQDYYFFKTASGKSYSLSGSASDQASSSAALTPEVLMTYRDISADGLLGTEYIFYLPNPVTEETILARLTKLIPQPAPPAAQITVVRWPVFWPQSATITCKGQSIRVSVNVQVEMSAKIEDNVRTEWGNEKGMSDDFSATLSNNSIQLPPCIHGAIVFQGVPVRTMPVSARAVMAIYHSDVGAIVADKTKNGTAYGEVLPTSLPAVRGPTTIPTSGVYLLDANVAPYQWGYSRVSAVVFNAASLAPPSVVSITTPPVFTSYPLIAGDTELTSTLIAAPGTATGWTSLTGQWWKKSKGGSYSSTGVKTRSYTVARADGDTMKWQDEASNSYGTVTQDSNEIVSVVHVLPLPVIGPPPTISGDVAPGSVLTAIPGGANAHIYGEWWKNGEATGVISTSYSATLDGDDVFWRSTATNGAGDTTADSNHIVVIAPFSKPLFTTPPVVEGDDASGSTLVATPGTATGKPTPVLTGEWFNDNVATGVTGLLYSDTVVGHTIFFRNTATNSQDTVSSDSNAVIIV